MDANINQNLLFHVLSHLPATDLLKVKLVSRRFCALVNSPHAWMNAFARYFTSTEALKSTADTSLTKQQEPSSHLDRRSFSRLTPNASWRTEYLIRTRLLRCLSRGRPSLPFASPCPGKPGRGSATFTYNSRLRMGCSSLHADFGSLFDKRKPQFIHGLDATGSVTSSDRKGKFDSWGFIDRVAFRHFSEVYPGYAQWGLGPTDIIGIPNVMDVSQPHGMVYGEGTPGGFVFHLASDERHGRYLAPFLNIGYPELGIPKIHQDHQCICSVWIAKSSSLSRMSRGAIGILAGSSSGVVSAFSFGSTVHRDNRFERGQLTARWLLSPGVPIVSIMADDDITDERRDQRRVWAVALNALGETFILESFPSEAPEPIQSGSREIVDEVAAWRSGQTVEWDLILPTTRSNRYQSKDNVESTSSLPSAVFRDSERRNTTDETRMMEAWLHKSPVEIKAEFKGWDMRRFLQVDFGGQNGRQHTEDIVIVEPGLEEGETAKIWRFARRSSDKIKNAFGQSRFVFALTKAFRLRQARLIFPIMQPPPPPRIIGIVLKLEILQALTHRC